MRLLPLVSIVLVLAAAPACERSTDLAGMSEEDFVSAMSALRKIERDATLDSTTKAIAREVTLQERNLTPELLEAAARELAADPAHALTVWARIDTVAGLEGEVSETDTTQ